MQKILTHSTTSQTDFENFVNFCLEDGWKVLTTNCGFSDSGNYNFTTCYQAILIKESEDKTDE